MVDYNPNHVSILTQKSYPPSRMRTYSSSNRLLPRSSFMSSLEDDLVSLTVSSSPQSRRDSLRGSFKMGNRGNQNAIGTDWTVELACLKQSSSIFEVRTSLSRSCDLIFNYEVNFFISQVLKLLSALHIVSQIQAAVSLERIKLLLSKIELSDRTRFCKADFDSATNYLSKTVISTELSNEIMTIRLDFFNEVGALSTCDTASHAIDCSYLHCYLM